MLFVQRYCISLVVIGLSNTYPGFVEVVRQIEVKGQSGGGVGHVAGVGLSDH